eukprot:TRINITY_DN8632_c0_g1_i8.p1 TRINITY_DN8632_c0_g1~~TRINITY_DN8632_c0_g1_i8.p1  ORF type:complete len:249 (-),score=61.65 TRINITY_DN8632_c0_g1_i8:1251-1910(-)
MAASDLAADEDMKSLLALFEGVDVKDQAKIAVLNALSETIRAQVVNWLQERAGSQQPVIDGDAVGSGKSDAQKPEPGMASAQNAIVTDEDTARDVQSSQGTSTTDTSAQNATVSDEATAHDIQSSQGTPAADVVLLAVQENNLQELQRLLKEGNVGLNVADAAGETPCLRLPLVATSICLRLLLVATSTLQLHCCSIQLILLTGHCTAWLLVTLLLTRT